MHRWWSLLEGAVVAVGDLARRSAAGAGGALGGGRHHGRRCHRGDAEGEAGRVRRPVGRAGSHG